MGERKTDARPQASAGVQPIPVQVPQLGRALLQQDQAFPRSRHPLRQGSRQLPSKRQARSPAGLAANFKSPRPRARFVRSEVALGASGLIGQGGSHADNLVL